MERDSSEVLDITNIVFKLILFNIYQNDCGMQHSSTVHYMELIDENPNCTDNVTGGIENKALCNVNTLL